MGESVHTFVIWALPAAIAAAACSSSGQTTGGDAGGSSVSADQACADAANALCTKISACSALFLQITYGDLATCASRAKVSCVGSLNAKGIGQKPSDLEACVQALPGTSCDDALDHNLPAACQAIPGQLANGAPCGDSSQCKSTFCNRAKSHSCGACASPPANGASCTQDSNCPTGSICSKAGTCVIPGAAGAQCDSMNQPCKLTLVCKPSASGDGGAMTGVCAAPDAAGVGCTASTCDLIGGNFCDPASMKCKSISAASAGQTCGYSNGTYALCAAAGLCNPPNATVGTCMASAPDGMNCDSTNGPPCMAPAVCENGVCTIPNPSNCN
jgi:hypothetical protein